MKKIFLTLIPALLFLGCYDFEEREMLDFSFNDFPPANSFITFDIVLSPNDSIKTKDQIVSFVESYVFEKTLYKGNSPVTYSWQGVAYTSFLEVNFDERHYEESLTVYVHPYYNDLPVLPQEQFPQGMPITLYADEYSFKGGWRYRSQQLDSTESPLYGQKIILVDGLHHLADSSYKGYCILPLKNENSTEAGRNHYGMKLTIEGETYGQ